MATRSKHWLSALEHDPIAPLLESGERAVVYFARRDLLDDAGESVETIWSLPEVESILRKQSAQGCWTSAKNAPPPDRRAAVGETWRHMRFLIDQYEMTRSHPAVQSACEFVFSCQSDEGDFRGILCNQYAPYYTGAILALLIRAGYADDPRVEQGMRWLLRMRQADGGWVIGSPGLINRSWKELAAVTSDWDAEPAREFDRKKPFSAAGTGMAIRAFAVHLVYRRSPEARQAAELLKSKFLKKDNYSSYEHPDNWLRFQFPFWWNHLLSALDAVSMLGFTKDDGDVARALEWLRGHQQADALWKTSYSRIHKEPKQNDKTRKEQLWVTLCACRIYRRLFP